MAILKIKKLIQDLENNTTQVLANPVAKATSAGRAGTSAVATTAVAAGSAAYAGTSSVAATGTSGSKL
jgi:hypothetical protein